MISTRYFNRFACGKSDKLAKTVSFTNEVSTFGQCAVLCRNTCVAIVVKSATSGNKQCALVAKEDDIPAYSEVGCGQPSYDIQVFKDQDVEVS